MPGFHIISMYTRNTPYEEEVVNLRQSLEQLDVPHTIYPIDSLGSWEKNCQQKANCIRTALQDFEEDIVWVDADAVVNSYPQLFEELEGDLAFFWFSFDKRIRSGTLFLRNRPLCHQLVNDWIALNESNQEWDQVNLQTVWEKSYLDLIKVDILPASYCKIFDNKYQQVEHPVITHFQASRRFKEKV